MPIYTYECPKCKDIQEHLTKYADRDDLACGECGSVLYRSGTELFTQGKPAYQMQAVLGNGDHLKGHFNKSAIRKKKT